MGRVTLVVRAVAVVLALTCGAVVTEAGSLVANGSFEQTETGRAPAKSDAGVWKLAADGLLPTGWKLNSGYPGDIAVLTEDPRSGKRCLRLAAPKSRDTQIYRPCPAVRTGRWYRVSFWVRDGAATLLFYEYRAGGGVQARSVSSGTGPAGGWKRFVTYYTPPAEGFERASVVLLVPRGKSAVLDDVVVTEVEGVRPPEGARPVRLENDEVRLVLSGRGELESLVLKATGEEFAERRAPVTVLTAVRDGERIPVNSLEIRGGVLTAGFVDPEVSARIRVRKRDAYFLFEVAGAKPEGLDALELQFPVRPQRVSDAWMGGTYGDTFGICHMGVTANTENRLPRYGPSVAPQARWIARHGLRGGRSALIATRWPRFLRTIRDMEKDTGLPSPMLRPRTPEGTVAAEWARLSPVVRRSYLFLTAYAPGDLEKVIRYAKLGGFGLIMFHRNSWRTSGGHETINERCFPGGLPGLKAAADRIHAAGLDVGLHAYGPGITVKDSYVSPVPDPRLLTFPMSTLAKTLGAEAVELVLKERPALPGVASPGVFPGDLLRIGDEIILYRRIEGDSPCRVTGLTRGALGTRASAHRARAPVKSLAQMYGYLMPDPDSDLPEEMGAHLARVVNTAGIDMVYFDGFGVLRSRLLSDWYYENRVLLASCAGFDHGVLVQTSRGPGRQLAWHLIPRAASADGHGDLKGYLDARLPGIRSVRRTLSAADIGWYALDLHGRPDELGYVLSRCLGAESSVSVQATRQTLETHPRAREVFESIARHERFRLAGGVPEEMRAKLLQKKQEFRLFEVEDGKFELDRAEYEPERLLTAIDGAANVWTVKNPRPEPVRLAVEISRARIAATPADWADTNTQVLADFADLGRWKASARNRFEKFVVIGGRRLTAQGPALRGLKAGLSASSKPREGRAVAVYTADNGTNGAGWCGVGKRFPEPRDLSGAQAFGLWVHGDGRGETLVVMFADAEGRVARIRLPIDHTGWRFRSFLRSGPRDLDWKRIEYLLFELAHLPPRSKVAVRMDGLRALPKKHEPRPLTGLTLTVGESVVRIPQAPEPGKTITLDGRGKWIYWPGGMEPGRRLEVTGPAPRLAPGPTRVELTLDAPGRYAGDLLVRLCRVWPLL